MNSPIDASEIVEFMIVGKCLTSEDHSRLLRHIEDLQNVQVKHNPDDETITASICSVACSVAVLADVVRNLQQEAESMSKKDGKLWIEFRNRTVELDHSVKEIVKDIQAILDATKDAKESIRNWHKRCRKQYEENMKSLGTQMFRV